MKPNRPDHTNKHDNQIELLRYNFFLGVQGDNEIICGTCQHFETILDDSGSITNLGHCYKNCPVKNGLDKVHAESNVSRYINHDFKTAYEEYSDDV